MVYLSLGFSKFTDSPPTDQVMTVADCDHLDDGWEAA
jgi:hypothetical protein